MDSAFLLPIADVAVGPVIALGTGMIVLITAVVILAAVLLIRAIRRKMGQK